MRRHLRPIRRFAAMGRRRTYWISCKPALICTSTWTTTRTKPSWTSYSPKGRKSDGSQGDEHGPTAIPSRGVQAQEVRGLVGGDGGQHGALHRRQDRQ